MKSWIFRFDKAEILIDEDAVMLCPILSQLNQKELKYVILVEDYVKSPLRRKPKNERMFSASLIVFGKEDYLPNEIVKKAMEEYKSLLFDSRRETIDALNNKINRINMEIESPELTSIQFTNMLKALNLAQLRIDQLTIEIERDDEMEQLKLRGGKKLSFLEMYQRNRREYERSRKYAKN